MQVISLKFSFFFILSLDKKIGGIQPLYSFSITDILLSKSGENRVVLPFALCLIFVFEVTITLKEVLYIVSYL